MKTTNPARELLSAVYKLSNQPPYSSPETILSIKAEIAAENKNHAQYALIEQAKELLKQDWEETTGPDEQAEESQFSDADTGL